MIKHPTHEAHSHSRHPATASGHDSAPLHERSPAHTPEPSPKHEAEHEPKHEPDRSHEPSHQAIAARAYQKYLAEGRKDGHDVKDWLKAEQELRAEQEHAPKSSSAETDPSKAHPEADSKDYVSLQ